MTRALKTARKSKAARGETTAKVVGALRIIKPYFTSTQIAEVGKLNRDYVSKTLNYWAKTGVVEIIGRVTSKAKPAPSHLYRTTELFDKVYPKQAPLFPPESPVTVEPPKLEALPKAEEPRKVIPMAEVKKKSREEIIADSMVSFVDLMKELADSLTKALKEDA